MNILALIRAALEAFAAYYRTAEIRERRELRAELRTLRHEVDLAVNAGDAIRIAELQDDYADASASLDALLPTAKPAAAEGADASRAGG